ncbi:MAG: NADH-quinone oxidoreductase subunit C, partial [Nocardioidaceae bacterium]
MTWDERVTETFGAYDEGFGPLTVDVPADAWVESATRARDDLGCRYFDWLSAVDEMAEGFSVVCHLAALREGGVDHLLLRTKVGRERPALPSLVEVYAGAGWHERETAEMFGIAFADGPAADPTASHLLLPEQFEGHPLRKEFVLASRVAKPWPGAKEPGESDATHGASPSRRTMRPPGVPDPEQWGPREPGSDAPDPLAHAAPGPARPRRTARERPPAPDDRDVSDRHAG